MSYTEDAYLTGIGKLPEEEFQESMDSHFAMWLSSSLGFGCARMYSEGYIDNTIGPNYKLTRKGLLKLRSGLGEIRRTWSAKSKLGCSNEPN